MTYPQPEEPGPDEFRGFDEARMIMWRYEARARVHRRIGHTPFLPDEAVVAVHVNNISQTDRIFLTAFDRAGQVVGDGTLEVDEPDQRLDVTPEFDHDYTSMRIPEGSELRRTVGRENGWVIDMEVLRDHDLHADQRATQRAVVLAHLSDMLASGQARGFLLERIADPGASPGSEAA